MKEILLTRGQVALVDDSDYEWLNEYKWYARYDSRNSTFYASRDINRSTNRVQLQMHREILKCPSGMEVDHINRNTLDNRKQNLRLATRNQNALNRKTPIPTSGVRGIQMTPSGTYRAGISINGKYRYLPTRQSLEEAIADRKLAESHYYSGEFLPID